MLAPLHKVSPSPVLRRSASNWDGSSSSYLSILSPRPFPAAFTVDFLYFLIEECVYKFLASLVAACHWKKLSGASLRRDNVRSNVVKLNSVQADVSSDRITARGVVSKRREFQDSIPNS